MEKFDETKGRKVAINIVSANVFSIVLLIVSGVVFIVPFYLIWGSAGWESGRSIFGFAGLWLLIAFFAGIVVHELLHGITWACYAKSGWKSISFGVMWKLLTPYCHCNEPMGVKAYLAGALMPLLVLGIIPAVVSLIIGSTVLLGWGILFIAAASGDIWMSWLLTKEDPESTILDHPTEAGFYVFDKEADVTPNE
ncbi:MAG: DUF3267 domain-containing protein [Bacteroidaceae bacterium]|nr:DUF3267 domain-containing protein [Bacteroidaceae bacterium]